MKVQTPFGYEVDIDPNVKLREDEALDSVVEDINRVCNEIVSDGTQIYEGSATPQELSFLLKQVRRFPGGHVLEIGMNAGISTVAMLASDPKLRVVSYDLGEWDCAKRAAVIIAREFPLRHVVVWGDSKKTLPKEECKFDFAFVDGGHDYETAYSDITWAARCAPVLMIDDVNMPNVNSAVGHAIANGFITILETHKEPEGWVPRSWSLAKSNLQ